MVNPETRRCSRCREVKPLDAFYSTQWLCHPCLRIYNREWRAKKRAEIPGWRYGANFSAEKMRHIRANWKKQNPEKDQVHRYVQKAIRQGLLVRPETCSECGRRGGHRGPLAHHDDYSKPLEVRWLCQLCHSQAHWPVAV